MVYDVLSTSSSSSSSSSSSRRLEEEEKKSAVVVVVVVFFRNECASLRRFCVESFLTIKKREENKERDVHYSNPKICETLKISLVFLSLFLSLSLSPEYHHEHTHASFVL